MKNKFIALGIFAAFVFGAIGYSFAGSETSAAGKNELVGLLPASDIVVNLNAQKLVNTALPQVFSSDPAALTKINSKIDELKDKTGFDMRQFQHVSVGIAAKQISANEVDFEPFVLARGTFSAGALLAVAKLASNGKYKEKKIGGRTVYIFSGKDIAEKNKPKTGGSMTDKAFEKMLKALDREVAVAAYDSVTLAVGTEARLREAFEKQSTVSPEVIAMVDKNPNAVVTFGGKFPNGLSGLVSIDNDEIGRNLDGIRQISGALTVENDQAQMALAAKTQKQEQAQSLQETLEGLKMLGKVFLGNSDKANNKVFVRMIENSEVGLSGNEVSFAVNVPQSDIDILLGKK